MRVSTVRIRPTDSPTRRRRRRREQNSWCCCLGMVALCALIALVAARRPVWSFVSHAFGHHRVPQAEGPTFPLSVSLPRPDIARYDLLPLEVTYVRSDGRPISDTAPELVVRDARGDIIETVGEVEKVPLRYDGARGVWLGSWPVPFGAAAGPDVAYLVEARATFDPRGWQWETPAQRHQRERENRHRARPTSAPAPAEEASCVAFAPFRVLSAPPPTLPPAMCAVTWEPDFPLERNLPSPDGKVGDWKVMLDWAEFMGADALWFRGGVTEAYGPSSGVSDAQPFNPVNIEHVPELAQEARRRGLKFGVWVSAYETYPNRPSEHLRFKQYKPRYRWTENFSRSRRVPEERAAISLLDPNRPRQIAQFFAQMQAIEGVDFVGMDYIRSGADWGGYELVEPFAREMPVKLPADWAGMSRSDRMGWICDMLEAGHWQTNIDLYHQWNWWRAHRLSEIIGQIVREAGLKVPLWAFTLSWWHGEQHGQDPLMFADAGVGIDAVMLYECDSVAQFDQLVEQWRADVPANQTYLVGGDQVSWSSHQRLTRPAGPEEFYRRITTAAASLTKGGPLQGAFVHDVSRICLPERAPTRGPGYSGREWALAGAAAFSETRRLWGVYPIECRLTGPASVPLGATGTCQLTVRNRCEAAVKGLEVQVRVDGTSVNCVGKKQQVLPTLKAGQEIRVPLQFQIVQPNGDRANRFMVAAQVRWPEGNYGEGLRADLPRLYTVMTYVNAR
jgi:hypothetical protein